LEAGGNDAVFTHDALLYAGADGFMSATLPLLRDAIAAGEPALVAVDAHKIELLKDALGPDADAVTFAEMRDLGRNPARIIPVWRDFVEQHADSGRRLLGIGEPVWPGRSDAEMSECECHELLLNVAFDDGPGWRLACPYDTEALAPEAIEGAHRTHPWVTEDGVIRASTAYARPGHDATVLRGELPPPPVDAVEIEFTTDDLPGLRWIVADGAKRVGLDDIRTSELVLAVHELATNSLMHGGGNGVLRLWEEHGTCVCEVRDEGRIEQPLVGRSLPVEGQQGGHGLWLVNQMCDLVQLRTSPAGNTVRVRMAAAA
jgi:anti-sigma regulatory factor (Ser/Thr protein kinase)